ncbi:sigma 54-interacting transcriptional regulator, partial [candidate division WOR-3 bacterium]|nr:sigma 54-interacting transcriptional regulator [candidate division WOR-3 bacterium]
FLNDYQFLPLNIQTKLLKFIETGSFRRLGGIDDIKSNIRIIASTTLQDQNSEKIQLSKELFSKFNTLNIEMPPLRKRKTDINLLINDFLIINNIEPNDFEVDPSVSKILNNYNWPGNIFELEDLIKQAILLTNGKGMYIENIPINIATFDGGTVKKNYSLDDIDKQHIHNVLLKAKGNKAKAARILGVDRKTLYRKIEKLGIMEDD